MTTRYPRWRLSCLVLLALSFLQRNASAQTNSSPPCAPMPSGLAGWWKGEDTTLDAVSGTNAVIQGHLTFGTGEVGQAFLFNGVDADLQIQGSTNLDVGAGPGLTIETWILPTNSAQESVLLEWNDGSGFIGTQFALAVP